MNQMLDSDIAQDISQTLGIGAARRRRPWRWVLLALVLLAVAAGVYWTQFRPPAPIEYRTTDSRIGTLTVMVTATGTLQPLNQVDVGAEISGLIVEVAVDFNDPVVAGQVLARLDTQQLEARVLQAQAALEQAEAAVAEAEATREEAAANARRLETLAARGISSQHERDTAVAAAARAAAAVASAEAQVKVAAAALEVDLTTLGKAVIRSPIDGIVIARNVEVGQTVAASFQAPVLFTLAGDLSQMELHLDIDEADIGQVRAQQTATFTVDAYPDRLFDAELTLVRYAPQENQGVVSYETLLSVDNPDLLLRPGMTATADIVTAERADALLVPNGALRFVPPDQGFDLPPVDPLDPAMRRVWVLEGGAPVPLEVRTGFTDGRWTEIVSGDLTPDTPLITDVAVSP